MPPFINFSDTDVGGNNVIVQKLMLVPEGHTETTLDLTGC